MNYYEKILEDHNCHLVEETDVILHGKIQKELYLRMIRL